MTDTIKRALFSPVITGAALYVLTKAPSSARDPVLGQLHQILAPHQITRLITALKWLFALGVARNVNSYLNELANDNFYLRPQTKGWVWSKEIAVVTGGASGFGALFSNDLAAKGIHVIALDINDLPANLQGNPRITFKKCDVTDHQAVMDVAKDIQTTIGHPTILINNAGIGASHSILETPPGFLRKIFDVNLISHYYTVQAFLPNMIANKKGHVVSIASLASFISAPGIVHYCATKSGALAFHEGLASELRASKNPEIKASIIHPTWANTALLAGAKERLEKAGQKVIDPQIVSDAVVKQIVSCRGGQVIIGEGGSIISTLRSWPTWLRRLVMGSSEKTADLEIKTKA